MVGEASAVFSLQAATAGAVEEVGDERELAGVLLPQILQNLRQPAEEHQDHRQAARELIARDRAARQAQTARAAAQSSRPRCVSLRRSMAIADGVAVKGLLATLATAGPRKRAREGQKGIYNTERPRQTPCFLAWPANRPPTLLGQLHPAPVQKNMRSAPPRLPSTTCVLRYARRA